MKAKDIKPGVVYAYQRGRGEYAPLQAVVLLAPADGDHLYQTTSHHRAAGSPLFAKVRSGAKPKRGQGWSAPDVGYPVVIGPAEALEGATLEGFEATTSHYYNAELGAEFKVLTSLTGVVGLYEDALAEQKQRQEEARQQWDREERAREAAQRRARALTAALRKVGVDATPDNPNNPAALVITLDEVDKLLALLPVSEED
ncbi:hypothetical protein [Sphaerisporangium sp. TRM90804]|uniref:hypothetical protein n=1 Tax=Sphaerisporangium sp. TRM90804 TaxID=3031113 RepID=UPI00244AA4E3|nr:hypothetical protein [Sphaerisporangium sp. TRM90804]MDH2424789.1 hypothetical protein [Sphaerisporangium sp. TRM90804]